MPVDYYEGVIVAAIEMRTERSTNFASLIHSHQSQLHFTNLFPYVSECHRRTRCPRINKPERSF